MGSEETGEAGTGGLYITQPFLYISHVEIRNYALSASFRCPQPESLNIEFRNALIRVNVNTGSLSLEVF